MVDSGAHPPKMAACWNEVQYWGERDHMHGRKPSTWSLKNKKRKVGRKERLPNALQPVNLEMERAELRSCVIVNIK